jgi:hypothetical protein
MKPAMTKTLLLALAACSSSATTSTPTPPATTPAPPPAVAAVDASPLDAASAGGEATPDPELASASPWVFRFHSTGLIVREARIETWTLRHVGDRAMVLVERGAQGDTTYTGTATDAGTSLKLELTDGANSLAFDCTRGKIAVAAANAVRQPHRPTGKYKEPCSGDPGRFVPAKTTKLDVLNCRHPDYEAPMSFAAAPGVEYLYVNDDCNQQGGGYRRIPADGSVAPVR